jgi:hypothetical protein
MRQVIAVAAGFILWSVGWLCYNASLRKFGLVSSDQTQPIHSVTVLLALLAGSCILSLLAGFTAAFIARSSPAAVALGLGLLLVAVGLFFQIQLWRLMPFWYHLLFLVLLVPICFAGAWLRNAMT